MYNNCVSYQTEGRCIAHETENQSRSENRGRRAQYRRDHSDHRRRKGRGFKMPQRHKGAAQTAPADVGAYPFSDHGRRCFRIENERAGALCVGRGAGKVRWRQEADRPPQRGRTRPQAASRREARRADRGRTDHRRADHRRADRRNGRGRAGARCRGTFRNARCGRSGGNGCGCRAGRGCADCRRGTRRSCKRGADRGRRGGGNGRGAGAERDRGGTGSRSGNAA